LYYAYLTSVNLNGADLRGADLYRATLTNANLANSIDSTGSIYGLNLGAGETLLVRDYEGKPDGSGLLTPIPIHVLTQANLDDGSRLTVLLRDATWGSTISFDASIPVQLGGVLDIELAPGSDPAPLLGKTFNLFDWTGVTPTGRFSEIVSGLPVDASRLYSEGTITVVPEPGTFALLAAAGLGLGLASALRRKQRQR
jgi:hypothetical protein